MHLRHQARGNLVLRTQVNDAVRRQQGDIGIGRLGEGIELMHMIRKGQFAIDGVEAMSFADQFFVLAGIVRPVERCSVVLGKFCRVITNATEPLTVPYHVTKNST
jgi:hypothetical protein